MPSIHRMQLDMEVKFAANAPEGTFSGYGAVFGNTDENGDVIERGAFKGTLRDWEAKGKLPKMLLQHGGGLMGAIADDLLPIGRWTSIEENTKGLKVEGQLFALDTDLGRRVYAALKAGELDGLSIGFRTKKFRNGTKAAEPRRYLEDVELLEVSLVTYPANPIALVGAVKSRQQINTIREFEAFLREEGGFSHAASRQIAKCGFKSSEPRDEDGAMSDLLESIRSTRAGLSATSS